MSSACIIRITNLSGDVICNSFAVHDGLSSETIAAIKADIDKTINQRLMYAGVKIAS